LSAHHERQSESSCQCLLIEEHEIKLRAHRFVRLIGNKEVVVGREIPNVFFRKPLEPRCPGNRFVKILHRTVRLEHHHLLDSDAGRVALQRAPTRLKRLLELREPRREALHLARLLRISRPTSARSL